MTTTETTTFSAVINIHDDELDRLIEALDGKCPDILAELEYARRCIEESRQEQRERVYDMFGGVLKDLEDLCKV